VCAQNTPALLTIHGRAVWPAVVDVSVDSAVTSSAVAIPVGETPCSDVVAGDVDGDGDRDVVLRTNVAAVTMLNTNGAFASTVQWASRPSILWGGISVGDLTGDGTTDVIVGADQPARLFLMPPVLHAADVEYAGIEADRDLGLTVHTSVTNIVGGAATGDDLVFAVSTAPGSLVIRH
jgi:hypothetical protein